MHGARKGVRAIFWKFRPEFTEGVTGEKEFKSLIWCTCLVSHRLEPQRMLWLGCLQLTDLAGHMVTLRNCPKMCSSLHFPSLNQRVICLSCPWRKQVGVFTTLIWVICSSCLFKHWMGIFKAIPICQWLGNWTPGWKVNLLMNLLMIRTLLSTSAKGWDAEQWHKVPNTQVLIRKLYVSQNLVL